MSLDILIVSPERRPALQIEKELKRQLPQEDLRVEVALDLADARGRLEARARRTMITAADIPSDENSSVVPGEYLGARLIAWAESRIPGIESVIYSEVGDTALNMAVDGLKDGVLRTGGVRLFSDIAATVVSRRAGAVEPSRRYLNLTIRADSTANKWSYVIRGEGFSYPVIEKELKYDERSLANLKAKSLDLYDEDRNLRRKLETFGKDLVAAIFKTDVDFWFALADGLGRIRGPADENSGVGKLKICFQIDRSLHPIFFEALSSEESIKRFWMLEAPISRTLSEYRGSAQTPLFACGTPLERKKLNCLIIESSASGLTEFYNEAHQRIILPDLGFVEKECDELARILAAKKGEVGRCINVKDLVGDGESYLQRLTRMLKSGEQWDLVHYSGHSLFDKTSEKGYLFFPSANEGELPEILEISEFAALLKGTRFLFLSGCETSSIDFLESLARCGVAAAIGYRRPVVDEHASEYSGVFYRSLFENSLDESEENGGESGADIEKHLGCLQHAFLEARNQMSTLHPNDWIWANPVLLVQTL